MYNNVDKYNIVNKLKPETECKKCKNNLWNCNCKRPKNINDEINLLCNREKKCENAGGLADGGLHDVGELGNHTGRKIFDESASLHNLSKVNNFERLRNGSRSALDYLGNTPNKKPSKIVSFRNFNDDHKDNIHEIFNQNHEISKHKIVYNLMGGRPSLKIKINGFWKHCLLDTGARINAIDESIIAGWKNIKLKIADDKVSCANGSALKTKGRAIINVEIDGVVKEIEFIVAQDLSPSLIGGVEFLRTFGIRLEKSKNSEILDNYNYKDNLSAICSIDAQFGKHINDEMRFKKAFETLKLNKNDELYNIISRNRNIFMANKWDIGKTNWIKHTIETREGPILVKPRRQPMHLDDKIDLAIKNLEEYGIIQKCESQWNAPLVCVWKKEKK